MGINEQMDFPSTFDEFAKDYGFKDKNEVYTNGSELIPVFRVKQWLEHISTTRNCESCRYYGLHHEVCNYCYKCSLWTEVESTTKKDLGVDCISRADAIRVASGYCHPSNVAKELAKLPSVTPQESFKPMVEIDLYSVIKQKYIEREVLDKIRAEIIQVVAEETTEDSRWALGLKYSLKIIDKYKTDTEKA